MKDEDMDFEKSRSLSSFHPSSFTLPPWSRSVLHSFLVAALFFQSGCDSGKPGPQYERWVHIVVVAEAKDDPTWAVLQATADWFEARARFAKVDVIAPVTHSPREQRALLQDLVTQDVNAVCVAPTDAEAIRSVINQLVQIGKPVVTIGRDVPGSNRGAYCGASEVEIGRAAAEACAAAVKMKRRGIATSKQQPVLDFTGETPVPHDGMPVSRNANSGAETDATEASSVVTTRTAAAAPKTVMLLHAGLDDPVYGLRYLGFVRDLPLYDDVMLLREINCARNRSDAVRLVRLESRKYPRVGCWVFLEDWPLRVLPSIGRLLPPGCGIVLCNGSPRYFRQLVEGQIVAMITYDYRRVAEEALSAAVLLAEGNAGVIAPHYTATVEIITIEDLISYEDRWNAWKKAVSYQPSAFGRGSRGQ